MTRLGVGIAESAGSAGSLSAAERDGRILDGALRRLPVDQRAVLALHHLEGRSVAELATILEIPPGTVKSRLHTARQALRVAIDRETGDR